MTATRSAWPAALVSTAIAESTADLTAHAWSSMRTEASR